MPDEPDPLHLLQRVLPAYEQISHQLREMILNGSLPVGSRLPNENSLATTFGVSRATVREALRGLATDGLIVTTKGSTGGSFVASPSVSKVSDQLLMGLSSLARSENITLAEFMEFRSFLEIPACEILANAEGDNRLDGLARSIPGLTQELTAPAHYALNRDFHFAVVHACGNQLLSIAAVPVFLVLQTRLDRSKLPDGFHQSVALQHRGITQALEAREGKRAAELMREHLDWLHSRYRGMWKSNESVLPDPERFSTDD